MVLNTVPKCSIFREQKSTMTQKRIPVLAILLVLSTTTFFRIPGNENLRLIQFISVFTIGAVSALLIQAVVNKFRKP